jgi:hypothetical protein
MRTFLFVLTLPLAGCLGVTLPPKPVPDWAIQQQASDVPDDPQPQTRRAARHRAPQVPREAAAPAADVPSTDTPVSLAPTPRIQPSGAQPASVARPVVKRKPTALPKEGEKPTQVAEPDWQARDAGVSRTINSICRGC